MKKTNALRILDQHDIPYGTVPYAYDSDNLNVERIATENGLRLEAVYKTLVVKGDKTGLLVALIAGHSSLNFKKLAQASGNRKVAMVPVKDLQSLTGYQRGGCSPVGMKKPYPVYLDESVQNLDTIYVNAGARGLLFSVMPKDLLNVTSAVLADLS